MIGKDLCNDCRIYYIEKYGINAFYRPDQHCHHEKIKVKCWCEYPEEERNNWNVSIRGPDGIPDPVWDFTFCPVCGRKLNEKT